MKNKDNQESDASWLLKIPDELKLQVFKNLSPKDLSSVSQTCSQLNNLIQDPRLWTELTVDLSETRRSLIWKVNRCPWLKTLRITNITGIHYKDHNLLNKISSMVSRAPNLVRLQIMGFMIDEEDIFRLISGDVKII